MRLARGGSREDSARTSLGSEGSPSTLAMPPRGEERGDLQQRHRQPQSRADQRTVKAEMLRLREEAGAALERRRARSLTKVAASVLQRQRRQCDAEANGDQCSVNWKLRAAPPSASPLAIS